MRALIPVLLSVAGAAAMLSVSTQAQHVQIHIGPPAPASPPRELRQPPRSVASVVVTFDEYPAGTFLTNQYPGLLFTSRKSSYSGDVSGRVQIISEPSPPSASMVACTTTSSTGNGSCATYAGPASNGICAEVQGGGGVDCRADVLVTFTAGVTQLVYTVMGGFTPPPNSSFGDMFGDLNYGASGLQGDHVQPPLINVWKQTINRTAVLGSNTIYRLTVQTASSDLATKGLAGQHGLALDTLSYNTIVPPSCGLTVNAVFNSSTTFPFTPGASIAPIGLFPAFNNVIKFYQTQFCDPITINVRVGWGEVNGGPLAANELGKTSAEGLGGYSYSQIRTNLLADKKTADDDLAVSTLPVSDPTSQAPFEMSRAEAKALGFLDANAPETDGWVGFNGTKSWTFNPLSRAVPGSFDFLGVAGHELTEVMGRFGHNPATDTPLDLFRYFAPLGRELNPTYGLKHYFSLDNGTTQLHCFNSISGGDLADWATGDNPNPGDPDLCGMTTSNDSYNAFSNMGVKNGVSILDLRVMDVIGYDRVQFTDAALVGIPIKAVHITDLRVRIDALRDQFNLGPFNYSRTIIAGMTVQAADVLQMRTALSGAYANGGVTQPTYSTTPQAGGPISAADIIDLRTAVINLEAH